MTAVEWADKHFYLSPESSYVEGPWTTQPVQVVPLNLMGNDDVRVFSWRKSARIGYTKMLSAAVLYLGEHKKRNIGIWREDDGAAAEFVNLELDPAIRDCKPVAKIFPDIGKKSEKNKVDEKHLTGFSIHIRGGQAAGGYRALSKDVVVGDEIDGFVQQVRGKSSNEGDPMQLMQKRLVGSSFPKAIFGTTPTVSGSSHIEKLEKAADVHLRPEIPCPHCDEYQELKFGDGRTPYGFRWDKGQPESVKYQCECCHSLFEYTDYLDQQPRCIWRDRDRDIETTDGLFFTSISTGTERPTPAKVHCISWAAYSPTSPWSQIVQEWLDAEGDKATLQVFRNTTLGEYWHEGVKKQLNADSLFRRREYYPRVNDEIRLPNGAQYITAGVDTQDNRFAYEIVAWGENKESWSVEYKEIIGLPDDVDIQNIVVEKMRRWFYREDGLALPVSVVFHDAGGSFYDDVLAMAARVDPEWWIPCKGDYQVGQSYIKMSTASKPKEAGCYLFMVGTSTVGDLVYRNINQVDPAPVCHWPITTEESGDYSGHDQRYFDMLTAEKRELKNIKGRDHWIWTCDKGVRNEAWDCRRYATAAVIFAEQYKGLDLRHVKHAAQPEPKPQNKPKKPPRRRSDYWNRER